MFLFATFLALAPGRQDPPSPAQAFLDAHAAADAALVAGDCASARAEFERCLALSPANATVAYGLACAAAGAHEIDGAFEWLERAIDWGYADDEVAEWDPDLATLRDDARWCALRERMRGSRRADAQASVIQLLGGSPSSCARFAEVDPTGRFVARGDARGRVDLLDARDGRTIRELAILPGCVWRIAFHPAGRELAVLTTDGLLYFLDLEGAAPPAGVAAASVREACEPQFPFLAYLEYDPTGERLLVRADERGASLWTAAGELVRTWSEPRQNSWYVDLAWSADGCTIAWPQDGFLWFLDGRTGATLGDYLDCGAQIDSVDRQPGGELVATGLADGRVCLWKRSTGELVSAHALAPEWNACAVNSVRFSPDGSRLAFAACETISVGAIDARTGELNYFRDDLDGHWCEPLGLLWSPDASRFWYGAGCGGAAIVECDVHGDRPRELPLRGHVPRAGPSGLAAIAGTAGIACFDTRTGRSRWFRLSTIGDRYVVQAPSGHFSGELGDLRHWSHRCGDDPTTERPLAEAVGRLYDPKRVRAARDGVPVLPFTR